MSSLIPQTIKDLGKATLTKVADKFVDFVITKYTGKSIKVFQAEAEIEADKVKTRWEVLEKPFWLQAEAAKMNRQYSNFGKILLKAAPLIEAGENKVIDDNDVFWGLLEHSKEISNDEIQELVAKIIAGEYNNPGTYSMSTLQTLKMLGKQELQLFERVSSLLINDCEIPQLVFNLPSSIIPILNNIGINYVSFQTLQSLGLILPNVIDVTLKNPSKGNLSIRYFDKEMIYFPENNKFKDVRLLNLHRLSHIGTEILVHLKPVFNEEYYQWLKRNFLIENYQIIE